ncbi:MAG: hypothetical protein VB084_05645 [Syntrophomonadaceae bacterium]|nr:hypothetical protein [Syntrophomonadaceae bacterium]
MNRDISLWTPVVVSSLTAPHICSKKCNFTVGPFYKRIEDIKVRIRNIQTEKHGKYLEIITKLETVILLEDMDGRTVLISRPETIKERLGFEEFDRMPQAMEPEISYITKIQKLNWDADHHDNEVNLNYFINYMILAVREQLVRLYPENEFNEAGIEPVQVTEAPLPEVNRLEKINEDLKHKLFLYEKDMLGLKRAIKKTEEQNAMLHRELSGVQQLVQTLRDAVTRKDLLICQYENRAHLAADKPLPGINGIEPKLGQLLKRMFMGAL